MGCVFCSYGNNFILIIVFDNYFGEIIWIVIDGGIIVVLGGFYGLQFNGFIVMEMFSFLGGDYIFIIFDFYGDGICCVYGSGFYNLSDELGNILAFGGVFVFFESINFCVGDGGIVLICNDGI